ncbi:MAG TPA: FkbM family methyltransferase [Steroidobacteraceae bacterium]|jgi:hypothetical protein
MWSGLQGFNTRLQGLARLLQSQALLCQQQLQDTLIALKKDARYSDPRSLVPFGRKVYSQTDEDGFICEIFNRIGTTDRSFVEFGIGNGLENNSYALLFSGWKGIWIEGDPRATEEICRALPKTIAAGALKVINSFITRDNINELLSPTGASREIDLLSVDIDGNDFHVFDAITIVRPRVVVIEYNAKFPPPIVFCMDYDASHVWSGDDCFGASLQFLEVALRRKGYALVGCSLTGANAFFVREDLVADKFLAPFTAQNHYEPARYHLTQTSSGHRASFSALERSASARIPA